MELRTLEGDLTDPSSAAWSRADHATISLAPVPLDAQPTEYIRIAWSDRPYGRVDEVDVATARSGSRAYVRLEWADADEPNTEFADSAAVYFPVGSDAPASTIGSPEAEVGIWYWMERLEAARSLIGTGPGAFRPSGTNGVSASAKLEAGRWALVLEGDSGDLSAARLGVAVWDGSNDERAGIGAATTAWLELTTEP